MIIFLSLFWWIQYCTTTTTTTDTIWGFHRVSRFKHFVLKKIFQYTAAEPNRIHVIDRVTDAGLMLLTVFILLEILNLKMGVAVKGVVAVGSIWTVVVSLAVKETVSNFIHGILLSASDRIYEGDSIRLSLSDSEFRGTVARLGWLETVLRGTDDVMITIPNAQFQGEQVANLSRINVSQVYQTLRFSSR
jgi:small-conductance mechanosensitive channel